MPPTRSIITSPFSDPAQQQKNKATTKLESTQFKLPWGNRRLILLFASFSFCIFPRAIDFPEKDFGVFILFLRVLYKLLILGTLTSLYYDCLLLHLTISFHWSFTCATIPPYLLYITEKLSFSFYFAFMITPNSHEICQTLALCL